MKLTKWHSTKMIDPQRTWWLQALGPYLWYSFNSSSPCAKVKQNPSDLRRDKSDQTLLLGGFTCLKTNKRILQNKQTFFEIASTSHRNVTKSSNLWHVYIILFDIAWCFYQYWEYIHGIKWVYNIYIYTSYECILYVCRLTYWHITLIHW